MPAEFGAQLEAEITRPARHSLNEPPAPVARARAEPLAKPFALGPESKPTRVVKLLESESSSPPSALVEKPSSGADGRIFYRFSKRAFDISFGLILMVFATPLILIAAAVIRLESKGNPFFLQTRLGRDGRPFKIVKLRGMYRDARARFPTYYDYSAKQNLDFCFHHEEDPRVTRAGKFFRKTSIDELPNMWNVLIGDMSLVGPRPEIPEVLALYGSYRDEYLSVKPGVTCLSKVAGRDRLTKRETIETDLKYIRERSTRFDMKILWLTIRSVMLRRDVF